MDQILDTISTLLDEITNIISDYLLLIAGLGAVLLLILVLVIARKRRNRYSGGDGSIEFLEVGPEPVIVYRRAEQLQDPEPVPEKPQPQPALPSDSPEEAEPQPESPGPEAEPVLTEPEVEAEPYQPALPELDEEPRPEPVMDPEPQPDPEPEAETSAKPQIPPANKEPLPYLESELANNTLKLFDQLGFQIERIVYQGIYGGDFIAVRPGVRAYVQVKDWKKKVTANIVSEVNGYANTHDCNQAIIVTSANFNRQAKTTAARMNVSLWNPKTLKKLKKKPLFPSEEEAAAARE